MKILRMKLDESDLGKDAITPLEALAKEVGIVADRHNMGEDELDVMLLGRMGAEDVEGMIDPRRFSSSRKAKVEGSGKWVPDMDDPLEAHLAGAFREYGMDMADGVDSMRPGEGEDNVDSDLKYPSPSYLADYVMDVADDEGVFGKALSGDDAQRLRDFISKVVVVRGAKDDAPVNEAFDENGEWVDDVQTAPSQDSASSDSPSDASSDAPAIPAWGRGRRKARVKAAPVMVGTSGQAEENDVKAAGDDVQSADDGKEAPKDVLTTRTIDLASLPSAPSRVTPGARKMLASVMTATDRRAAYRNELLRYFEANPTGNEGMEWDGKAIPKEDIPAIEGLRKKAVEDFRLEDSGKFRDRIAGYEDSQRHGHHGELDDDDKRTLEKACVFNLAHFHTRSGGKGMADFVTGVFGCGALLRLLPNRDVRYISSNSRGGDESASGYSYIDVMERWLPNAGAGEWESSFMTGGPRVLLLKGAVSRLNIARACEMIWPERSADTAASDAFKAIDRMLHNLSFSTLDTGYGYRKDIKLVSDADKAACRKVVADGGESVDWGEHFLGSGGNTLANDMVSPDIGPADRSRICQANVAPMVPGTRVRTDLSPMNAMLARIELDREGAGIPLVDFDDPIRVPVNLSPSSPIRRRAKGANGASPVAYDKEKYLDDVHDGGTLALRLAGFPPPKGGDVQGAPAYSETRDDMFDAGKGVMSMKRSGNSVDVVNTASPEKKRIVHLYQKYHPVDGFATDAEREDAEAERQRIEDARKAVEKANGDKTKTAKKAFFGKGGRKKGKGARGASESIAVDRSLLGSRLLELDSADDARDIPAGRWWLDRVRMPEDRWSRGREMDVPSYDEIRRLPKAVERDPSEEIDGAFFPRGEADGEVIGDAVVGCERAPMGGYRFVVTSLDGETLERGRESYPTPKAAMNAGIERAMAIA